MALNTGVNIADAVGDIENLEQDIKLALRGLLQQKVDEAVRKTAEEFRDEVQNQLKLSEIEQDTGELMNSWVIRPKGFAQYEVRSTADHAVYLELGTRPHTISGKGGGWLKFIPDNPSEYNTREFVGNADGSVSGDFFEDGIVQSPFDPLFDGSSPNTYFAKSVQHPGNEAYGYFEDAVDSRSWRTSLNNRVLKAVDDALDEVGL